MLSVIIRSHKKRSRLEVRWGWTGRKILRRAQNSEEKKMRVERKMLVGKK